MSIHTLYGKQPISFSTIAAEQPVYICIVEDTHAIPPDYIRASLQDEVTLCKDCETGKLRSHRCCLLEHIIREDEL